MRFFKKLMQRENIVAVFLIVLVFITVFGIPQKFGISELDIILIMLGFLALDTLIERIGYLGNIESKIKKIENVVAPHPNTVTIKTREVNSPDSFKNIVLQKQSVFVHAVSANSLVTFQSRSIEDALKQGANFRFLLTHPDNPSLNSYQYNSQSYTDLDILKSWIVQTKFQLESLAQVKAKGTIELRWFEGTPTFSLVGYDLKSGNGIVEVEHYVFKRGPENRPTIRLHEQYNPNWFSYYDEVIDDLWDSGVPVDLKNVLEK